MMEEDWNDTFYDLFREAVGRYHEGHRNVDGFFTDQEIIFLSSIGCRTRVALRHRKISDVVAQAVGIQSINAVSRSKIFRCVQQFFYLL